jgi:Domain of unknown function (DUF397)
MTEGSIPDSSEWEVWRKSSYSNTEGGSCVEALDAFPSGVPVRDSKAPDGPALVFPATNWSAFLQPCDPTPLPPDPQTPVPASGVRSTPQPPATETATRPDSKSSTSPTFSSRNFASSPSS